MSQINIASFRRHATQVSNNLILTWRHPLKGFALQLSRHVSVFGWDRVTTKWRDAIDLTLKALATQGWWILDGNLVL
jgi:hypothetical protein